MRFVSVKGVDVGARGVNAAIAKLLTSRKLVLISVSVLLIGTASSAATLFFGKDRLLGRSYGAANGYSCETVQTVNIRKNGARWIRKYIRLDEASGLDRIKTALRVASVVYADHQPDLVQITVLDKNGPTLRSNMRGRAIAAQVVFVPDLSKFPDDADVRRFSGYYHDGAASADGMFYGLRIDLPYEDIEKLALAQDTFVDCKDPDGVPTIGAGNGTKAQISPANLGTISPSSPDRNQPVYEEEPDSGAETPQDLLTSTPVSEEISWFSFRYMKTLLFGKGPSVAQAAGD